ncbi:MAG: cbb3-type cytochrome c oxidase subunit I [Planctomycetes bacterium]|nr:cbb3-type cytochrome c oxidase subunit I [Planctomycetota bacterium]
MDGSTPPPAAERNGANALIRWHGFAALACVLYVALLGIVMAIKLHEPEWLGTQPWLTWGRLRYAHTQGVFFGWLGNAFFAFLYYAVPRLAGRPVTGIRLGWALFGVWNFLLVLPGWAAVQAGYSQPLEWAEFPLPVDAAATLGLLLAWVQFCIPLLRARVPSLYVSAWYVLGGLTFTLFAYPVGNVVPELLTGAQGATFSGLWIHDAVGLYVTPMAVAILYAVIPAVTRRPIYSHFLSMIGFWLLFLVYPLNGTHHYVFSSIPMEAQKGAIVASVYLGADVLLVVGNLLLSLRKQSGTVAADVPLRFVWVGTVAYLIVSLQGSMQAVMPVNRLVHFTDWVIGHSHLAMIGFASFAAIGGLLHAWRRTPGCRYNPAAANWAFWLLAVGLTVMVADLTIAGLVQGIMWQGDGPWIDSVSASKGFWWARSVSGFVVLAGFLAVVWAMTSDEPAPVLSPIPAAEADPVVHDLPTGLNWLKRGYVLTAVAGLGLFAFSFVVLGVWPNQTLKTQIAESRPVDSPARSPSEERGRLIYAREGCFLCHSQMVRFTEDDVRRFGPASQAWESDGDAPQMWGTRRIGPDLAREGGRKSRDWQLAHLWNPRHVVSASNMPGYPWLFDGSATQPSQDALDVVNYLESLGRDARLTGLTGPKSLPGVDPAEERQGMFCDCAIPRTSGGVPVWTVPAEPGERDRYARRGAVAFARHCAGCHGTGGRGDGPAANALTPAPRDLTTARFSDRAVSTALWAGKPGSSMPPWVDLPPADLRGLVAYLRTLHLEEPVASLTDDERGKATHLFNSHCAVCHGASGGGDGVSASRLAPAPTNFREVQPDTGYAEVVLANGVRGTTMPKWSGKLTPSERHLLFVYVRTLYAPKE